MSLAMLAAVFFASLHLTKVHAFGVGQSSLCLAQLERNIMPKRQTVGLQNVSQRESTILDDNQLEVIVGKEEAVENDVVSREESWPFHWRKPDTENPTTKAQIATENEIAAQIAAEIAADKIKGNEMKVDRHVDLKPVPLLEDSESNPEPFRRSAGAARIRSRNVAPTNYVDPKAVHNSSVKMLCVTVCKSTEDLHLARFMRAQLHQCDEHVIASNQTLADVDHKLKVAPLIDGPLASSDPDKNPLSTDLYLQIWKSLAKRSDIQEFDWIVKIDPDTFFRPSKLRGALKYYTNKPVIVAHRPNNETHLANKDFLSLDYYPLAKNHHDMWYQSHLYAIFAISRRVFDVFRNDGCDITAASQPHEDGWWQACLATSPFQKINARLAKPESRCVDFVWNAYIYRPNQFNSNRFPLTVSMLKSLAHGKDLYHKQGFCMSHDIAAFHPVKDPKAFYILQAVFEERRSVNDVWQKNDDFFGPVGGWSEEKSEEPVASESSCCAPRVSCVKHVEETEPGAMQLRRQSAIATAEAKTATCVFNRPNSSFMYAI